MDSEIIETRVARHRVVDEGVVGSAFSRVMVNLCTGLTGGGNPHRAFASGGDALERVMGVMG